MHYLSYSLFGVRRFQLQLRRFSCSYPSITACPNTTFDNSPSANMHPGIEVISVTVGVLACVLKSPVTDHPKWTYGIPKEATEIVSLSMVFPLAALICSGFSLSLIRKSFSFFNRNHRIESADGLTNSRAGPVCFVSSTFAAYFGAMLGGNSWIRLNGLRRCINRHASSYEILKCGSESMRLLKFQRWLLGVTTGCPGGISHSTPFWIFSSYLEFVSQLPAHVFTFVLLVAAVVVITMRFKGNGGTEGSRNGGDDLDSPDVEVAPVEVPSVEVPSIEIPSVEVSSVEVPSVEVSSVEVPSVEAPSVEVPSVEAPSVEVPPVKAPSVEIPSVEVSSVEVPSVENPSSSANEPQPNTVFLMLQRMKGIGVTQGTVSGDRNKLPSAGSIEKNSTELTFGDVSKELPQVIPLKVNFYYKRKPPVHGTSSKKCNECGQWHEVGEVCKQIENTAESPVEIGGASGEDFPLPASVKKELEQYIEKSQNGMSSGANNASVIEIEDNPGEAFTVPPLPLSVEKQLTKFIEESQNEKSPEETSRKPERRRSERIRKKPDKSAETKEKPSSSRSATSTPVASATDKASGGGGRRSRRSTKEDVAAEVTPKKAAKTHRRK